MARPRIKVDPEISAALYHCISHEVDGAVCFDDPAKEQFRRQFRKVADYCGVEIRTYTLLSNHFHLVVYVPKKTPLADEELLRRYQVLHPNSRTGYLRGVRQQLAENGPEGQDWRRRQLAQMGDISPFMKSLKQRFSTWYNRANKRHGTLWRERFKSHLVDPANQTPSVLGAYVDLNSVRAGVVKDPKDYRFCGYAEAVAGDELARRGLMALLGVENWEEAHAVYRLILFGTGSKPKENAAAITPDDLKRVVAEGGKLPLATVLLCRIRYFSDGAVLGRREFVAQQLIAHRARLGRRTHLDPQPVPSFSDFGELTTLRALRGKVFG
jgi:putative transposase